MNIAKLELFGIKGNQFISLLAVASANYVHVHSQLFVMDSIIILVTTKLVCKFSSWCSGIKQIK